MVKKTSKADEAISAKEQEIDFLDASERYDGPPNTGNVFNGKPFVGPVVDIKSDDPQHKQPYGHLIVHTRQLDTTKKEDMKEYVSIHQAIASHQAALISEDKQYNKAIAGWHILICWGDLVYMSPYKEKDK